jgi:hypothetical protein
VIIDHLYVVSIAGTPSKAYAPLIVDPDAVLAGSVALQCLQPVAGRYTQEVERCCGIDLQQLPMRQSLDVGRKSATMLASKKLLRLSIREALDHGARVRPELS